MTRSVSLSAAAMTSASPSFSQAVCDWRFSMMSRVSSTLRAGQYMYRKTSASRW